MRLITRLLPFAAFVPALAFAQGTFAGLTDIFGGFTVLVNQVLVPLVFALAFLLFIYGVFKYVIQGGGDPDERDKGKQLMIWGIIGFVVMVSLWGIVNMLSGGVFGATGSETILIPQAPVAQ